MDKKRRAARAACSLLLATTAACTTIDSHVRVEDWPRLEVIEHRVSFHQMVERCRKYTAPLMTPLGCTEFYFATGEAHIWVSGIATAYVLEHEREHAAGYDHLGSDHMQRLWHNWQAAHPAAPGDAGIAASTLLP